MFDDDLEELSPVELLSAAGEFVRIQDRAAVRILEVALTFADRNAVVEGYYDGGEVLPGYERIRVYGGDGCPGVAEFAPIEFGAACRMSSGAAAALIGEALALRHRLPRTWAAVLAGTAVAWRARKIAHACLPLSLEAAAIVDRRVAGIVNTVTPGRLKKIVTAAVWQADPEQAQAQAEEAARTRGVFVAQTDPSDDHGTKRIWVRAAAGDVIRFDATIDDLARALKVLGDSDPLNQRRAKAIGWIADPAAAHHLLEVARHLARTHPTHVAGTDTPHSTGARTTRSTTEGPVDGRSGSTRNRTGNKTPAGTPDTTRTHAPQGTADSTGAEASRGTADGTGTEASRGTADGTAGPAGDRAAQGTSDEVGRGAPEGAANPVGRGGSRAGPRAPDREAPTDCAFEDLAELDPLREPDPLPEPGPLREPDTWRGSEPGPLPEPVLWPEPPADDDDLASDGTALSAVGNLRAWADADRWSNADHSANTDHWVDGDHSADGSVQDASSDTRTARSGTGSGSSSGMDGDAFTRRMLADELPARLAAIKQEAHRNGLGANSDASPDAGSGNGSGAGAVGGAGRGVGGGGRSRHTVFVHLTDRTLATGNGVLRVEELGPLLAGQLAELLGHDQVIVKPVIDLNDQVSVHSYEIPNRIRERVRLQHPVEMFPYGTAEATPRMDQDHITPYDHTNRTGGISRAGGTNRTDGTDGKGCTDRTDRVDGTKGANGADGTDGTDHAGGSDRVDATGPPSEGRPAGQTGTDNLVPLSRLHHRAKTFGGWRNRSLRTGAIEWTSPHGFVFIVDHTGTHPKPPAAGATDADLTAGL
jgi:hypothetical protein